MLNQPTASDLLEAVAAFLRSDLLPILDGTARYQARVAANMLDLARREYSAAADIHMAELHSLRSRLGLPDGGLAELNALLCEKIASGEVTLDTPGIADHLWMVVRYKLAVDQPGYAARAM